MANYDFSTLNSSDLEELVCDLLNMEEPHTSPVKYKTFKDGKDKGIDLLYSTEENEYEHVGQVKHYYRTGYDGMLSVLKETEVKNVSILNPNKYILATSVDLSVANTEVIKKIFEPYIKNLNDIYGKKDLNRLIDKHDKILNSHYKLWLSDFSILEKLLGSELEFRSSIFEEHELKRRLRIYVKTSIFEDARHALKNNKFIIVTGEPGVGKTTLAEMLVYEYIADGYNMNYILDDIKEAERALRPDDSKQIIYFDDFLGSNKIEINRAKGSETALRRILQRISKMKNKLIVFTTRSFLLNSAIEESEKLRQFNIKAKSSLFELTEYNYELKKQLLINHIEESEINNDLKDVFKDLELEEFIITHQNFTPRSVEFITTNEIVVNLNEKSYKDFICKSFDYPDEIWKHAYAEQINEDERLLLNTLISFGEAASLIELEMAYMNRINDEIKNNNKTKEINIFRKVLNRLNGGFIIIKNDEEVLFINPSLIDFLVKYLQEDKDEVIRIANAVKFTSQLTQRLFLLSGSNKNLMPDELQDRILSNYQSFIRLETQNYDLIQLALVIYNYVDREEKDEIIFEIIEKIDDWESLHSDYSLNVYFKEFLVAVKSNEYLSILLNERIEEIVSELFLGESDIDRAVDLLEELTDSFNLDFNKLDTVNITDHLNDLFSEHIDDAIDWLRDWITDEGEAIDKRREFERLNDRILRLGLDYDTDLSEFDIDWYEIAIDNEIRRIMEKDD